MNDVSQIIDNLDIQQYRKRQFYRHYYINLEDNIKKYLELPKELRTKLADQICLRPLEEYKTDQTDDETSTKVCFKTNDNLLVESVLIKEKERNTVCVSTQVGCPIGCIFCATGKMGFFRNLTADEIVYQVLHFAKMLKPINKHVTNIVYMGMGEPLLNLENVNESLKILTDPDKINLGKRNITVSTVGVEPYLSQFLSTKKQYKIAISLHAPNQRIREKLVPAAKKLPIDALLSITRKYSTRYNKRISYEYIMLKDINDSVDNAHELADLFYGYEKLTFINLIIYNSTDAANISGSSKEKIWKFSEVLRKAGISCYIRFSKGTELHGACGQLATEQSKT